ncbi:MAG: hypothetical protein FWD73_01890 [Polyangiaceae bacterium]|nr:hypothetical protein [Polyangiaceae bacterium]
MTALAVLQIKMMHEDRDMANNEQQAAQKAADEAHDQKIEDMHKQANDTLMSGVMGGVFGGLSAAASGASAINNFEASLGGPKADVEKLKGGLGEACSKGFDAAGKFASSIFDAKKLDDKADEESADKDLDHAKSASDAASSRAKQDQDDIQTTINALRGITQSKAAIEQGTIIRA